MSFIGPRPLLMKYLPLYDSEQIPRHKVKPGLTGWAQVNGSNSIYWVEEFCRDVWYVDNCGSWLDLWIFVLTCRVVFRFLGVNTDPSTTMSEFTCSNYCYLC